MPAAISMQPPEDGGVKQAVLYEQLALMQAERDAALRHAASLQQSLNAALADASACRRGAKTSAALVSSSPKPESLDSLGRP